MTQQPTATASMSPAEAGGAHTGHTPGPWEAIRGVDPADDMRCGVSAARGDRGYLVATIENGAPGDICDTEYANARLIAAAPELLESVAFLLDQTDYFINAMFGGELPDTTPEELAGYNRARAAIAKACGQ